MSGGATFNPRERGLLERDVAEATAILEMLERRLPSARERADRAARTLAELRRDGSPHNSADEDSGDEGDEMRRAVQEDHDAQKDLRLLNLRMEKQSLTATLARQTIHNREREAEMVGLVDRVTAMEASARARRDPRNDGQGGPGAAGTA